MQKGEDDPSGTSQQFSQSSESKSQSLSSEVSQDQSLIQNNLKMNQILIQGHHSLINDFFDTTKIIEEQQSEDQFSGGKSVNKSLLMQQSFFQNTKPFKSDKIQNSLLDINLDKVNLSHSLIDRDKFAEQQLIENYIIEGEEESTQKQFSKIFEQNQKNLIFHLGQNKEQIEEKVDTILKVFQQDLLKNRDNLTAIKNLRQLKREYERKFDTFSISYCNIIFKLGTILYATGQYEQSLSFFEENRLILRELYEHTKQDRYAKMLAKTFRWIGFWIINNIQNDETQLNKANIFLTTALNIFQKYEDQKEANTCYELLYQIYIRLQIAHQLIIHQNNLQQKISLLYENAKSHLIKYQFEVAISIAEEALELCADSYQLIIKKHNIYTLLGVIYFQKGEYETALSYQQQDLNFCKNTMNIEYEEFSKCFASCYNELGKTYHKLQNFKKAEEYFNETLAIELAVGFNEQQMIEIYRNIGNLKTSQGHFDEAINNFDICLSSPLLAKASAVQLMLVKASILSEKANALFYMKRYKEADENFKASFEIFESQTDQISIFYAQSLYYYANTELQSEKKNSALKSAQFALMTREYIYQFEHIEVIQSRNQVEKIKRAIITDYQSKKVSQPKAIGKNLLIDCQMQEQMIQKEQEFKNQDIQQAIQKLCQIGQSANVLFYQNYYEKAKLKYSQAIQYSTQNHLQQTMEYAQLLADYSLFILQSEGQKNLEQAFKYAKEQLKIMSKNPKQKQLDIRKIQFFILLLTYKLAYKQKLLPKEEQKYKGQKTFASVTIIEPEDTKKILEMMEKNDNKNIDFSQYHKNAASDEDWTDAAIFLRLKGDQLTQQANLDQAQKFYSEATRIFTEKKLQDKKEHANLLYSWSKLRFAQGNMQDALLEARNQLKIEIQIARPSAAKTQQWIQKLQNCKAQKFIEDEKKNEKNNYGNQLNSYDKENIPKSEINQGNQDFKIEEKHEKQSLVIENVIEQQNQVKIKDSSQKTLEKNDEQNLKALVEKANNFRLEKKYDKAEELFFEAQKFYESHQLNQNVSEGNLFYFWALFELERGEDLLYAQELAQNSLYILSKKLTKNDSELIRSRELTQKIEKKILEGENQKQKI